MERKKINENLQLKIKAYLRYFWKEESAQTEERETEVISKLTKSLQSELMIESNSKILYDFPLFYSNFTEKSIKKVIPFLKELRFSPGDIIFEVNFKNNY